jgi:Serine incorporator (Serinc)
MRLAYLTMFMLFISIVLAIMYYTPSALGFWTTFIHCPLESVSPTNSMACLGVSAIYRMSLSLVVLFTVLLLVCMLRNEASKMLNENFWF